MWYRQNRTGNSQHLDSYKKDIIGFITYDVLLLLGFSLLIIEEFLPTEKRNFDQQKNHLLCGWWVELQRCVKETSFDIIKMVRQPLYITKEVVRMDNHSLAHTTWNCKYHIVFAPKFRRKIIYRELRQDIANILSTLCKRREIHIVEAEVCPDHIHMLVEIPPKISVSEFVGYLKGKSTLMIFERHANLKYKMEVDIFGVEDTMQTQQGKMLKRLKSIFKIN